MAEISEGFISDAEEKLWLKEIVAAGHDSIRTALELPADAPRRFDYYAHWIDGLRAEIQSMEQQIANLTAERDSTHEQWISAECQVLDLKRILTKGRVDNGITLSPAMYTVLVGASVGAGALLQFMLR